MSASVNSERTAQLAQAKLFAAAALGVERPFDPFEDGDPARVRLVLWQQAATHAIAAAEAPSGPPTEGVATSVEPSLPERAAGGSELLDVVKRSLVTPTGGELADTEVTSRATLLKGFTKRLIAELEHDTGSARQRKLLRRARFAWAGLVAASALYFLGSWLFGPEDLVPTAKRTLSSELSSCKAGECGLAKFHTKDEQNPWVSYDFGRPRSLHSIELENRLECCYERAFPLVVESSNDQKSWKELARTERVFVKWSASLSGKARYVRVRLDGKNFLHLRTVEIR